MRWYNYALRIESGATLHVRRIGRTHGLVIRVKWLTWALGFEIMHGGAAIFVGPLTIAVASLRMVDDE